MPPGDPGSHRAGIIAGVGAYLFWGLFPLYWGFLEPATPYEVLAARMVFALLSLVLLVAVAHQWAEVRGVLSNRRQSAILAVASVLVSVNWGVFIWAVANDMVVDTALGYFINPLVSVALGVLVLRERLRSLQWVAVAIASAAVLYATVSLGSPPWVALALAFSFGFYGLATKIAGVDAIPSLFVQTLFLTPFALGYLVWLAGRDELTIGHEGIGHTLLMIGAGPVTAAAAAALRLRGSSDSADAGRAAAVHRSDAAAHHRTVVVRRDHECAALGSLRRGVGRSGGLLSRRRAACPLPADPGGRGRPVVEEWRVRRGFG